MPLIHHHDSGQGRPPIVFVHGFGCDHRDWNAQVSHLAPRHRTLAVDLRGHGASPGEPSDCTVERYGADIAELLRHHALDSAVLVGHSMGCRVVVEAALQAPARVAGLVLVDGSQFAPEMQATLMAAFGRPGGYSALVQSLFKDMFTAKSEPRIVAAVAARAERLPAAIGESLLADMQRYDVHRLTGSLASLRIPVAAIQSTYTNAQRQRTPLRTGQTTPYLEMLRRAVPEVRIDVIEDTGHFPQLDEPLRTNALLDSFLQSITVR